MYTICVVIGGIAIVVGFFMFVIGVLCQFEEGLPFVLAAVCLVISIGCGIGADAINKPFSAEIPEDGCLVVNGVYDVQGKFIRKTEDPEQSLGHCFAYGPRTILLEVSDREVLEMLMDVPAPSVNQLEYMEELAAKCGVELPSIFTANSSNK